MFSNKYRDGRSHWELCKKLSDNQRYVYFPWEFGLYIELAILFKVRYRAADSVFKGLGT